MITSQAFGQVSKCRPMSAGAVPKSSAESPPDFCRCIDPIGSTWHEREWVLRQKVVSSYLEWRPILPIL